MVFWALRIKKGFLLAVPGDDKAVVVKGADRVAYWGLRTVPEAPPARLAHAVVVSSMRVIYVNMFHPLSRPDFWGRNYF